jgi:hypothetical protein
VGAKVVAHLADQVEAKIARANRAFRLSSRIIAATKQELESHGEWLDRHRTSWAEEVKRHRRLLNRKLALGAVTRFIVGLVFAAPFALARAVERRIEPRASPVPRPPRAEPPFTRQAAHDLRIGRLEERLGANIADTPRARPEPTEKPKADLPRCAAKVPPAPAAPPPARADRVFSPAAAPPARADRVFSPAAAPPARADRASSPAAAPARTDRVSNRAIAALALFVVAAGVFRAIFTSAPAEETARVTQKMTEPGPGAPATLTVVKSKRAEPPLSHSGFAVIEGSTPTEGPRTPPQTIAAMIAMSESLPAPSVAAEAASRPLAAEPVARKPATKAAAAKAKPKRKVAARDTEPASWWQEWSWIKVR